MKTIGMVVCALAMAAGCVDVGPTSDESAALTGSGSGSGTTSGTVWHSVWNGGSAFASSWGYYSSAYIDAYENTSAQNRSAFLSYGMSSVDPTSEQCYSWTDWWGNVYSGCYYTRYTWSYGWGQIPSQAFQATRGAAHLKYTIGSDASFYTYQCTIDYSSWVFTCGVATGGAVDIVWTKDGQFSQSNSGTSSYSFGPYTFQTSGTYSASSAHATGSMLGVAFDGGGQFGDTHQANVTKDILNTPRP